MRLCSHCHVCGEFTKGYDPCKCKPRAGNQSPYVNGTSSGDYTGFKQSFGVDVNSARDVDRHLKEKGMVLADESHLGGCGKIKRKDYNWDKIGDELIKGGVIK